MQHKCLGEYYDFCIKTLLISTAELAEVLQMPEADIHNSIHNFRKRKAATGGTATAQSS